MPHWATKAQEMSVELTTFQAATLTTEPRRPPTPEFSLRTMQPVSATVFAGRRRVTDRLTDAGIIDRSRRGLKRDKSCVDTRMLPWICNLDYSPAGTLTYTDRHLRSAVAVSCSSWVTDRSIVVKFSAVRRPRCWWRWWGWRWWWSACEYLQLLILRRQLIIESRHISQLVLDTAKF